MALCGVTAVKGLGMQAASTPSPVAPSAPQSSSAAAPRQWSGTSDNSSAASAKQTGATQCVSWHAIYRVSVRRAILKAPIPVRSKIVMATLVRCTALRSMQVEYLNEIHTPLHIDKIVVMNMVRNDHVPT